MGRSTDRDRFAIALVSVGFFAAPVSVFAAATTFREAADMFLDVLQGIIQILLLSLSVGLIYSLFWYFSHGENPEAREKYRRYMLWSLIGIIVTFGLWGILGIFTDVAIPILV